MNREEIETLKYDLIDLGYRIQTCDKLIQQLKDESLKLFYQQQILILVDNYYELEKLLKVNLEEFIKFEKENGNLIDFTVRRLKKELGK